MVEVLEPRVLYSADSVASLLPLLLPDELDTSDSLGASLRFDTHSTFDEFDLLPDQVADIETVKHVVFIDSAVPEFETLKKSAASDTTTVVIVDSTTNGVSVISQTLERYSSLDSVQIVAHGANGQLFLGNQTIDEHVLQQQQSAISRWSNALSEDADILLLGCDVASGEQGRVFIQQLASLTSADVAASDDLTGHRTLKADWDLEVSTGSIESVVQLDSSLQNDWSHVLGTITVDTLTDKFSTAIQDNWGVGNLTSYQSANPGFEVSLREALYVAQNHADSDTIRLPGGVFTLSLAAGSVDGKWGDLNVSENTTIEGEDNPANPTTISQAVLGERIITASGGNLQLKHLTIANADTSLPDGGGAIFSAGSVAVTDSIFTGNSSAQNGGAIATEGNLSLLRTQMLNNNSEQLGGALYSESELTIDESVFNANSSLDDGGAVYAFGNTLTIRDSGFTGNYTDTANASGMSGNGGAVAGTADIEIVRSSFDANETRNVNLFSKGGAVYHEGSGTVSISDATFSGNRSVSGGAIFTDQSGSVTNGTFVNNTAILDGAAIQSDGATISIGNSVFSGNDLVDPIAVGSSHTPTGSASALAGNVASTGFNLYDFDPTSQMPLGSGDMVNLVAGSVSSQLNPLSTHDGSYVKIHALNAGSQAINAGTVSSANAVDSHGLPRDQVADIGASEFDSASSMVFWADAVGGIFRSDVDFSNVQQIVFGATNPDSLTVDETESKIYWLSNNNGNIELMSASLDGIGGQISLLSNLVDASSLALNSAAGHLYVAFAGNTPRIDRYDVHDLLSAPVTVVANNAGNNSTINQNEIILNPNEMAFSATANQLFWSDQGGGNVPNSIRVYDLATNGVGLDFGAAESIAVNPEGTSVFWTDATADAINEFDSDSSTQTQSAVAIADTNPAGIAYAKTEDLLLWVSDTSSSISSIDAEDKTLQSRYEHGAALNDIATMRTSTVTAVPTITTNSDMTVPEGSGRLLPKTNLIAIDPDTADIDIVYTVTQAPLHGVLTLKGNPTTTFTEADLKGDFVDYVHDGTETQFDQIEFRLSDGTHNSDRFKYDIQITRVNDAPTLRVENDTSGMSLKIPLQEAGTYVLDPALLVGFDAESAPSELVYHLISPVTAGIITIDGVEVTHSLEANDPDGIASIRFTGSQLIAGQVRFEHDGSELAPDSLRFKLVDGSVSNGESGTVSLDFDFVSLNDAPDLSTTATSVFENGDVVITNDNLVVEDPDSDLGKVVFNLNELPSHGTVEILGRGPLLSTAATFTQVELNNGLVSYTPNVNNADDASYQLWFVATDLEGASSAPIPLDIVVTGVNNTPSLTTESLEVEEGGVVVLSSANLEVADPDSNSSEWVLSYRDTDEMNGTISVFNQSNDPDEDGYYYFSYLDLLVGNVTYNHDGSEGDSAEVLFRVGDGISNSEEVALRLSVTPVNDIPSLTISNNTITADEGGQYVFLPSDFSYTDPDAVFEQMRIFFIPFDDVRGEITVAGASASSFTFAELADGQVVYTHDGSEPDITGTSASFNFGLSDSQSESPLVVLNIGIESKNDLPVFSFVPSSAPVSENTPGQVVGEITYTDADTGDIVEFSVSDDRFVLTPLNANTIEVSLGEDATLDFEEDTGFDVSDMRLEITAVDSNPNVERPVGYQGSQLEEIFTVGDVNDVPTIDADAVLTVVPGSGYTFDSSWVTDQDDTIGELVFTAVLADGSELPPWLEFNPVSRSFEVLEPESPALNDLEIVINIVDKAGAATSVPVSLLFEALTDPAAAEPVVEPLVPEEEAEPEEAEPLEPEPEPEQTNMEAIVNLAALVAAPSELSQSQIIIAEREEAQAIADAITAKKAEEDSARNDAIGETVDLHDLIKPLDSIGTLQLAVVDTAVGVSSDNLGGSRIVPDMDMRNLSDIFSEGQANLEAQSELLANAMDNKELADDDRSATSRALFGTSTGLTTGLSVGYLFWLVRGGTLMGSVLSSLPAWRFVDPLPVLGSLSDDMENDEETLESIVENEGKGREEIPVAAVPSMGTRVAGYFGWNR